MMKYLKQIRLQCQSLYTFLAPRKLSRVEQMLAVKTEETRRRKLGYLLIILIILL